METLAYNHKYLGKKYRIPLYENDNLRLNTQMAQENIEKDIGKKGGNPLSSVTFDDLLIAVGQTQNRDAFVRLFEYFAPRIKSFLIKSGMSPEEADELAQETMLTVWNKASSYEAGRAAASTWIYTIARNKRIDRLRKRAHNEAQIHEAVQIPAALSEQPDAELERTQTEDIISRALKDLPPEQATLIEKSFFEHKTHQEIAEETKLPLGTVKSRIRLALQRLQHNLKGQKI